MSASVLRVNSGSGNVTLSRVFGLEAELLTAGGHLHINALYGKKASLLSGGGHVLISHMSCEGLAAIDSAGGHVTVDGLEGNASILSAGGNIKVRRKCRMTRDSVSVIHGAGMCSMVPLLDAPAQCPQPTPCLVSGTYVWTPRDCQFWCTECSVLTISAAVPRSYCGMS